MGLARAADGSVYVADSRNARIQVFAGDGRPVREWRHPPQSPRDTYGDWWPRDVAVGPSGDVYVLARSRVYRFSGDGALRAEWSFKGSGIHLAVDRSGHAYVTSTAQSVYPPPPNLYSVFKFDADGRVLAEWRHERFPTGIAIDAAGMVHVAEAGDASGVTWVRMFDAQHTLVASWPVSASGAGMPGAIALDGKGHALVICGNAIMKYALGSVP